MVYKDLQKETKTFFTLEDRFCRFDKWEPIDKEWDKEKGIFVYSEYEEINGKKQIVKKRCPSHEFETSKRPLFSQQVQKPSGK